MGWHGGRVATRSAGFCEEHQRLDIRALHHCGLLLGPPFGWQWSRNGERRGDIQIWPVNEDALILKYQVRSGNGPWQAVEDTIRLDWTTVHFGGRRPWFRCR
jgi:hypothetical protein